MGDAIFKQSFSVFIALLGLSSAAVAQQAQTQASDARTCTLPEIADQAPLVPVSGSDLITVPVTLNGTG